MRIPRLSLYELLIIPEALYFLAIAKWKVLRQPARQWMPMHNEERRTENEERRTENQEQGNGNGDQGSDPSPNLQPPSPNLHPPTPASSPLTSSIARVIEGLGRRLPWKSVCLDQALAAHYMYSRRGIAHVFHLGVHKKRPDEMLAHAWISVGDKIVVGETKAIDYKEVSKAIFS